ncbi:polyhydroxyalkanoate synthesis repressor PhaR [Notoacmeibacter marinus]|uniref:Polyhydroxyalkanoate synthesis repressor PhaR n=1 Tax=Notoacmeibacter marinus TaxID=1876515 RepID=A0A231V2Y3_9HYPH|nr:polyhydroxyalkanoate synthesis repressor PhaR [Notoacmeibacter marinus]OXT02543.1 polyhydroxyalkanoate synthesis repressor PhaR [Notoacmeibacter marinus]
MAEKGGTIVIKKYANRRLYNTGTSTYVTLEDLSNMVKRDEDFVVQDAKTGADITHSVLTQIIFELENQTGNAMLPIPFLRQLIAYYGDQMQMFVPSYLEQSMKAFQSRQEQLREEFTSAMGDPVQLMSVGQKAMEEQARRNMEMFTKAMSMFNPFAAGPAAGIDAMEVDGGQETQSGNDLSEMKRQIAAMQEKLDKLGSS